jgi:hypothetical protein
MTSITTTRVDELTGVADGLFSLGHWHIVAVAEGRQGSEIIHYCDTAKDLNGRSINWCYSHWDDPICPGCGAEQPDEIQGLNQMLNADVDRGGSARLASMLDRSMKEIFWRGLLRMSVEGIKS